MISLPGAAGRQRAGQGPVLGALPGLADGLVGLVARPSEVPELLDQHSGHLAQRLAAPRHHRDVHRRGHELAGREPAAEVRGERERLELEGAPLEAAAALVALHRAGCPCPPGRRGRPRRGRRRSGPRGPARSRAGCPGGSASTRRPRRGPSQASWRFTRPPSSWAEPKRAAAARASAKRCAVVGLRPWRTRHMRAVSPTRTKAARRPRPRSSRGRGDPDTAGLCSERAGLRQRTGALAAGLLRPQIVTPSTTRHFMSG